MSYLAQTPFGKMYGLKLVYLSTAPIPSLLSVLIVFTCALSCQSKTDHYPVQQSSDLNSSSRYAISRLQRAVPNILTNLDGSNSFGPPALKNASRFNRPGFWFEVRDRAKLQDVTFPPPNQQEGTSTTEKPEETTEDPNPTTLAPSIEPKTTQAWVTFSPEESTTTEPSTTPKPPKSTSKRPRTSTSKRPKTSTSKRPKSTTPKPNDGGKNCGKVKDSSDLRKFFATVKVKYLKGQYHHCGAAILNSKTVLTAYHCVKLKGMDSDVKVVVDSGYRKTTTFTGTVCQNSQYKQDTYSYVYVNNYAVIKLNGSIASDSGQRPVCLPTVPARGRTCRALGGCFNNQGVQISGFEVNLQDPPCSDQQNCLGFDHLQSPRFCTKMPYLTNSSLTCPTGSTYLSPIAFCRDKSEDIWNVAAIGSHHCFYQDLYWTDVFASKREINNQWRSKCYN